MISQHMFHWPMLEKNVESVMSYVEIVLKLYFLDVKIFFTFFIRLKPFFKKNVNFTFLHWMMLIKSA